MIYWLIFQEKFLRKVKNIQDHVLQLLEHGWQVFLLCFIYKAAMQGRHEVAGMRFCDIVTYLTITMTIYSMVTVNITKLSRKVQKDKFLYEFLKPYSYRGKVHAEAWADFCSGAVTRLVPSLVVLACLGVLVVPPGAVCAALFVCGILVGEMIWINLTFLFEMMGFWYRDMMSVLFVVTMVYRLFGGVHLPYRFLPEGLAAVLKCTPLYSALAFPMDIYFGNLSYQQIGICFLVQVMWVLVLLFLGSMVFERGQRRLQTMD